MTGAQAAVFGAWEGSTQRWIVAEAITEPLIPADLTGVQWDCGTIECRARLVHPGGTLVAQPGDIGMVLTAAGVECDSCSDACSA